MTDRARPGLVALYDIRPKNGAGQFLQHRTPHGACPKGLSPNDPQHFGGSRSCLHPSTENDQIWRGNMRSLCILGQPRRCMCINASRGLSATTAFLVEGNGNTPILAYVSRCGEGLNVITM